MHYLLLIAKYQVNPFVQARADVVRLQSLPIDTHKLTGIAIGPFRENNIIKCLANRRFSNDQQRQNPDIERAKVSCYLGSQLSCFGTLRQRRLENDKNARENHQSEFSRSVRSHTSPFCLSPKMKRLELSKNSGK
jgi:hypothetical protein